MPIYAECIGCYGDIKEKAALLLGPPQKDKSNQFFDTIMKQHLCIRCFNLVQTFLTSIPKKKQYEGFPPIKK